MEYIRISGVDFKGNIGNRVFVTFLARDITVKLQKDQITKYIILNMVDKDLVIEARIFGANDKIIELVQEGKVYNAAIDIKAYDKSPTGFSCIVYNMDFSHESPESYIDWAEDLESAQKVIENILPDILPTYYGQIAYPLLAKNWYKFASWTAAKGQHHTRLGELLVHTSEVIEIAGDLADYFNNIYGSDFINKPLLISSAMIHDLEKINELDVNINSGKTEYSKNSVLCTHIMNIIADVEIQARKLKLGKQVLTINELGEDEETKTLEQLADEREAIDLLKHCLAAHHGKLEWGSPIEPAVPEAYILHIADNLSAEMYRYNRAFKDLEPGGFSSIWSQNKYKNTYKDSSK